MRVLLRRPYRPGAIVVAMTLLAAACSGGARPELTTTSIERPTVEPAPVEVEVVASAPDDVPEPADPWEVVTITADPTTGRTIAGEPTFRSVEVFGEPDGEKVQFDQHVLNPTYFGSPLTLMVTEGSVGDEWVKVQLPVRPNGSEAWVDTDGFSFETHRYHAMVDLSDFFVQVFDGDDLISETDAVIGRESAPTPLGRYFVNDKLEGGGGVYGSWILSLSAFSESLDSFNGGLPVIAIHGTNSPELVGTAVSSGCVRVPNDIIEFLANELPLGTPVEIVA
ncbi:MAG: L,D-transpeptidase [Acidimicrobiia bacterium]|nr:L,D-transpeptidase [Acidimicrobiia bacterium]